MSTTPHGSDILRYHHCVREIGSSSAYAPLSKTVNNAGLQPLSYTGNANYTGDQTQIPRPYERTDGQTLFDITVQGVRTFDNMSGNWTTPDAYDGDVADPMSRKSFVWNGNNPQTYSDPSGYQEEDDELKRDPRTAARDAKNDYQYDKYGALAVDDKYRDPNYEGKVPGHDGDGPVGEFTGLTKQEAIQYLKETNGKEELSKLFGQGVSGAREHLDSMREACPETALTTEQANAYRDLAHFVVDHGPATKGFEVQTLRLQILDQIRPSGF